MADANGKSVLDKINDRDAKFGTDIKRMMQVARLCENSERWQDGADIMVQLFKYRFDNDGEKSEPERAERDMLSNHFKNLVGKLRQAYREMSNAGGEFDKNDTNVILQHLKEEMKAKSLELINLVKNNLFEEQQGPSNFAAYLKKQTIPEGDGKENKLTWMENKVFYLKMCGDYYRYMAEMTKDDKENGDEKGKCKEMYEAAMEVAKQHLMETNPTRLGLALNWSVCCYELLDKKDDAKKVAKEAFDNAIQKLDTLNDSSYKDSTLIMQLLRDNLTIWTSEDANKDQNGEEQED
jgi:hypothetical protein